MKLVLLSDWHWGITKPQSIHKQAKLIAKAKPDVIINAGDNCGGVDGARATRQIFKTLRTQNPDTPILSVYGNHDLWSGGMKHVPSYEDYQANLERLAAACNEFDVQDLSSRIEPLYITKDLQTIEFFGQMMWYESYIRTNDYNFLPYHTPDGAGMYLELVKQEERAVMEKLMRLLPGKPYPRIFVSHMPVLDVNEFMEQIPGGWWGANRSLGNIMRRDYSVDLFLNGHTHGNLSGPVRFECGSDYMKPTFKIIEV